MDLVSAVVTEWGATTAEALDRLREGLDVAPRIRAWAGRRGGGGRRTLQSAARKV